MAGAGTLTIAGILLLALVSVETAEVKKGAYMKCGDANFTAVSGSNYWGGSISYINYGVNKTCVWNIYVPQNYRIKYWADGLFDIETCKSCSCDYVTIGRSCGEYTGDFLNEISSHRSGNPIDVNFKSDHSVNRKGFKMRYRTVSSESANCGSAFHGGSGSFQTPKHPNNYEESTICDWKLKANRSGEGREEIKVKLTISDFQLEKSEDCLKDYLEVREGDQDGPLIGRYCGNDGPSGTIESSGEQLWVRFRSDSNSTTVYKGFKASFDNGAVGLLVSSLPLYVMALIVAVASV